MATIELRHEDDRYSAFVDGVRAGFTAYKEAGKQRIFVHTEVNPLYKGHGLASKVVRFALEDVRTSGLRAVSSCPFVDAIVAGHEYDDILDPLPMWKPSQSLFAI